MTNVLWLQSAEVQQLLHRLVDGLDAAEGRGSTKARSLALSDRSWPALYGAPLESTKAHLWDCVRQMCRWGWLSTSPPSAAKSESGYAVEPRVSVLDVAAVRSAVGRPERVKSAAQRWTEAVEAALQAPTAVKTTVGQFLVDVPGRSMAEVVSRLNLLPGLRSRELLLREVSAHLFWGMSKVLDNRQALVAAILGEDECPFPESPVQLQVWLPTGGFDGVLFIENQMSFEKAIRAALPVQRLAVAYAAGFKAGAQRLRTPGGASVFYSSAGDLSDDSRAEFEGWLLRRAGATDKDAFFWGDLDYSGMRILAALRSTFPTITAWQPGYLPMLKSLREGGGHPPIAADKAGQRPLEVTGCPFADAELLPALRATGRFLDQEVVRDIVARA